MRVRRTLLALVLPLLPLTIACSDDDSSGPDGDETLVGTWIATSFTATGLGDLVDQGLAVEMTLTSNTYSITVTGDQLGALCDEGTSCTVNGPYTSTATTLTLDAGTVDATTVNYDIDGDEMTWTGNIDGTAITVEWVAD